MNPPIRTLKSSAVACLLLTAALVGCASPTVDDEAPGLPSSAATLIDQRYSSSTELRRAAEGFAIAAVTHWRAAVATGRFNEGLRAKAVSAQLCLSARSDRLQQSMSHEELASFIGALTSTPELRRAHQKANQLSSGRPVTASTNEAKACAIAGIE